jgi:hypothetical protein
VESDEIFAEVGPHELVWIEPVWKEHPSCKAIRSAYAVIANGNFIREPVLVRPVLTWIPLGRHKIVVPA